MKEYNLFWMEETALFSSTEILNHPHFCTAGSYIWHKAYEPLTTERKHRFTCNRFTLENAILAMYSMTYY